MESLDFLVDDFSNWGIDNTKRLTLNGMVKFAKCHSVTDGDTCVLIVFLDDNDKKPRWVKCRILGYDAPEIHTSDINEKEQGYVCKKVLEELILDKVVMVKFGDPEKNYKDDKFGRQLAKIWIPLSQNSKTMCEKIQVPHTRTFKFFERQQKNVRQRVIDDHRQFICINDWMLTNTDCYKYQGEKKLKWSEREHKCLGVLPQCEWE